MVVGTDLAALLSIQIGISGVVTPNRLRYQITKERGMPYEIRTYFGGL